MTMYAMIKSHYGQCSCTYHDHPITGNTLSRVNYIYMCDHPITGHSAHMHFKPTHTVIPIPYKGALGQLHWKIGTNVGCP